MPSLPRLCAFTCPVRYLYFSHFTPLLCPPPIPLSPVSPPPTPRHSSSPLTTPPSPPPSSPPLFVSFLSFSSLSYLFPIPLLIPLPIPLLLIPLLSLLLFPLLLIPLLLIPPLLILIPITTTIILSRRYSNVFRSSESLVYPEPAPPLSRLFIHGVLSQGTEYSFELPPAMLNTFVGRRVSYR